MPSFSEFRPFLNVGGALSVRTLSLVGLLTFATATAAALGTDEVAAHQVVSQWMLFLALIVDALAIAAQAMIGRFVGERDLKSIREAARVLLTWGWWIGVAFGVVLFLARNLVAGLFTDDLAVRELIVSAFVVLALIQPIGALVFVGDGLYLGAGAFRFLAVATVGAAGLSAVLLVMVPVMGWGLTGIWWAIAVLIAVRGVAFLARFGRKSSIG